jgi:AAA domain
VDSARQLVHLIEPLARRFFGEPNRALSSARYLCFGAHGSKKVDKQEGTYYDHEAGVGGGVLDLVQREMHLADHGEAFRWCVDQYPHEVEQEERRPKSRPNGAGRHDRATAGKEVAHYDYVDEAGQLLFQVVRFEPKAFLQRRRDEQGRWIWSVKGVRQVPYRLLELTEALGSEHLVFIVEGEKDADRLWNEGAPATTNAGGVGKWREELNPTFVGANVVIIADNDPQAKSKDGELLFHPDGRPRFAGFDHAHAVAAALDNDVADRVRVLDLGAAWRDCPPKGDISDWLDAGGRLEELYRLVDELPDWAPEQAIRTAALKLATPYEAPDPAKIPPRAWLHGGHYIRQACTATVAPGGFGKTSLGLYEALAMVAAGHKVWYLSGEDPRIEIDRRVAAHCQQHQVDLKSLPGRLYVDDRLTFEMVIAASPKPGAAVKLNDGVLAVFEAAIVKDQIDAVILDPFIGFHTVPENDNGGIDAVVRRLSVIAYRANCGVEILHHVRKPFAGQGQLAVEDARGASALINAVRSARVINRMSLRESEQAKIAETERRNYLRLDLGKANMRPPEQATWFRLASAQIANGDHVQALIPWRFPALFDGVTVEDTDWLRDLVRLKPYRADSRSDQWLGIEIARRFKLNVNDKADCIRINKMIGVWLANSVIDKQDRRDEGTRKAKAYYVPHVPKEMPDNVVKLFDEDRSDD